MERKEKALHVRIPAELHRKIAVYCAENDLTIKQFVIHALERDIWEIEVMEEWEAEQNEAEEQLEEQN